MQELKPTVISTNTGRLRAPEQHSKLFAMHVSQVFLRLNVSHKDMPSGLFGTAWGGFGELLQLLTGLASEQLWGSQPILCLIPMACAPLGSLRHQGKMPEGQWAGGKGANKYLCSRLSWWGPPLISCHFTPLAPLLQWVLFSLCQTCVR